MKPDWKDAPEWAKWLAQDDNGKWFWYEVQPDQRICSWGDMGGRYQEALSGDGGWRATLEKRP
ncbi:hypothetical protein FHW84_002529 [Dyella sp. SG562]|uniref:hypothetical protein n=1 Tax=Dyella sp. SG562 TaxID=2587017 RepID=UPI00141FCF38|nr:hypothetical protein [Dyella sp. SG562]NII73956.1 hypothetical protein [Dyella sp. SG562]